mmetsp:Transcript_74219/g.131325  ORF Transcript_74219/g.131325 Transcript_74219/m.131325 type:complete len:213 (-) Transcript_74219:7-645(-)
MRGGSRPHLDACASLAVSTSFSSRTSSSLDSSAGESAPIRSNRPINDASMRSRRATSDLISCTSSTSESSTGGAKVVGFTLAATPNVSALVPAWSISVVGEDIAPGRCIACRSAAAPLEIEAIPLTFFLISSTASVPMCSRGNTSGTNTNFCHCSRSVSVSFPSSLCASAYSSDVTGRSSNAGSMRRSSSADFLSGFGSGALKSSARKVTDS